MTDQQLEDTQATETRATLQTPAEDHCMLTTFSRTSGRAHDVEMRFAMDGDTVYMLSDDGSGADWVQNLIKNPEVSVRLHAQSFSGMGRVVTRPNEDARARRLLAEKYEDWHEGQQMSDWARTALPVAIDRTPHVH